MSRFNDAAWFLKKKHAASWRLQLRLGDFLGASLRGGSVTWRPVPTGAARLPGDAVSRGDAETPAHVGSRDRLQGKQARSLCPKTAVTSCGRVLACRDGESPKAGLRTGVMVSHGSQAPWVQTGQPSLVHGRLFLALTQLCLFAAALSHSGGAAGSPAGVPAHLWVPQRWPEESRGCGLPLLSECQQSWSPHQGQRLNTLAHLWRRAHAFWGPLSRQESCLHVEQRER